MRTTLEFVLGLCAATGCAATVEPRPGGDASPDSIRAAAVPVADVAADAPAVPPLRPDVLDASSVVPLDVPPTPPPDVPIPDTGSVPSSPVGAMYIVSTSFRDVTHLAVALLRALPVETPPVVLMRSGSCVLTPIGGSARVASMDAGDVVTAEVDGRAPVRVAFRDGAYTASFTPRVPSGSFVRVRVAPGASRAAITETIATTDLRPTTPAIRAVAPDQPELVPYVLGSDFGMTWPARADGTVTLDVAQLLGTLPTHWVRCAADASTGGVTAPWAFLLRHAAAPPPNVGIDQAAAFIRYVRAEEHVTAGVAVRTLSQSETIGAFYRM